MPIVESSFLPLRPIRWHRVQTIAPALLRYSHRPPRVRKRLELSDGDFLDIDCYLQNSQRAVIVTHGLEGSSDARYVRGLTNRLRAASYDVFAWNMRGCSGELNRQLRSYHSGMTSDLDAVIHMVIREFPYSGIALVGFSVGGNITLKYLGEAPEAVPPSVRAAAVFSVPTDLTSSAEQLARPDNALYMSMFLRSLFCKLELKERRMPGSIDLNGLRNIKTFAEYDARFIAPLFGFSSAEDYWEKASSLPVLKHIRVPSLMMTSRDDSFLASPSIPRDIARFSDYLHLEITDYGGHVGFMRRTPWGNYYSDDRTLEFLGQHL